MESIVISYPKYLLRREVNNSYMSFCIMRNFKITVNSFKTLPIQVLFSTAGEQKQGGWGVGERVVNQTQIPKVLRPLL